MTAYDTAGNEPPLAEVMTDPIIRHLRHYDGLDPFFRPENPAVRNAEAEPTLLPQAA